MRQFFANTVAIYDMSDKGDKILAKAPSVRRYAISTKFPRELRVVNALEGVPGLLAPSVNLVIRA